MHSCHVFSQGVLGDTYTPDLGAPDKETRKAAVQAMRSLPHPLQSYAAYEVSGPFPGAEADDSQLSMRVSRSLAEGDFTEAATEGNALVQLCFCCVTVSPLLCCVPTRFEGEGEGTRGMRYVGVSPPTV
jgi:hypothetical protein